MIKIDALYFLLLIELLVILAGATVFFVYLGRKYRVLYQSIVKELEDVRHTQQDLQQESGKGDTAPAATAMELGNCKTDLSALEENVKEKNKLLSDLQAKFDALEKEYLILYRQQQKQQADAANP